MLLLAELLRVIQNLLIQFCGMVYLRITLALLAPLCMPREPYIDL